MQTSKNSVISRYFETPLALHKFRFISNIIDKWQINNYKFQLMVDLDAQDEENFSLLAEKYEFS